MAPLNGFDAAAYVTFAVVTFVLVPPWGKVPAIGKAIVPLLVLGVFLAYPYYVAKMFTMPILGAMLIGLIEALNEGLTWHAPGSAWSESIVFSILILILVFRPEGLLGERTPEGG